MHSKIPADGKQIGNRNTGLRRSICPFLASQKMMFICHLFVGNHVPILITTSAALWSKDHPSPTPTKFCAFIVIMISCPQPHLRFIRYQHKYIHNIYTRPEASVQSNSKSLQISRQPSMAADSSFSSSTTSTTSSSLLLDAMDHLWFHHIILFSEPSSLKPVLSTPASKSSSNSCQISSISEEENMSFLGVHTNSSSSNTTIAKQVSVNCS